MPFVRIPSRRLAGAISLVIGLLMAACSEPEPRSMALEDFIPRGGVEVALNQTLVFVFSDELDHRSVTQRTVRVLDEQGSEVAGTIVLDGRRLRFEPRLPKSKLLDDGSFVQSMTYTVEVTGFPRPDGLRSIDGLPLDRTYRMSFRTVSFGSQTPVFDPGTSEEVPYLQLKSRQISPGEGITLIAEQGVNPVSLNQSLDPSRVREWAFELSAADRKPIPLLLELKENRVDYAEILLRPVDRFNPSVTRVLDGGSYVLVWRDVRRRDIERRDVGGGPTTLGGAQLIPYWIPAVQIQVMTPSERPLVESFDDSLRRSGALVQGVDGTAKWSGDGAVAVRFPRAAGSGRDGHKRLQGAVLRPQLEATRIEVVDGTTAELPSEGLVVLAAQRSVDIAGTLRRRVERGARKRRNSEAHAAWMRRVVRLEEDWETPELFPMIPTRDEPTVTLSEWLAEAVAADEAWTVIVCGGDLRVSGLLDVDGPLLIVTGGWIRVPSPGRIEARSIWALPGDSGGSADIHPPISDRAPLIYDELGPGDPNPLVEPVTYGVLSRRERLTDVLRWRDPVVQTHPLGSPDVALKLFAFDEETQREFGPVPYPELLIAADAFVFLVELTVQPNTPTWDPPRLDEVTFRWTTRAGVSR